MYVVFVLNLKQSRLQLQTFTFRQNFLVRITPYQRKAAKTRAAPIYPFCRMLVCPFRLICPLPIGANKPISQYMIIFHATSLCPEGQISIGLFALWLCFKRFLGKYSNIAIFSLCRLHETKKVHIPILIKISKNSNKVIVGEKSVK